VRGEARAVEGETVTVDINADAELNQDNLINGSETVRDAGGGTVYERGPDYRMDYDGGSIAWPVSSRVTDGQAIAVDYEYKPIGSYAAPNASPKKALDDVEVAATTDAMCESVAFELVDILSDPVEEGRLTIPSLPAGYTAVDALRLAPLPDREDWVPRTVSVRDGRVEIEAASRRSAGDVVADIQRVLSGHGERI